MKKIYGGIYSSGRGERKSWNVEIRIDNPNGRGICEGHMIFNRPSFEAARSAGNRVLRRLGWKLCEPWHVTGKR